jgi:hypothetical protein
MLKLVGAYGSPYSCKARAVLRYRRIPSAGFFAARAKTWAFQRCRRDNTGAGLSRRVGDAGNRDVDSSPQIRRLEELYTNSRVIAPDRALAVEKSFAMLSRSAWVLLKHERLLSTTDGGTTWTELSSGTVESKPFPERTGYVSQ